MHGIVLWVPMLAPDDEAAAAKQASSWAEERVDQWWDGAKEVSTLYKRLFGLAGPAWDVYLLYRSDILWERELPSAPTFWMHQLPDPAADPRLYLCREPSRLLRELDALT
jgi:hypothetical protein